MEVYEAQFWRLCKERRLGPVPPERRYSLARAYMELSCSIRCIEWYSGADPLSRKIQEVHLGIIDERWRELCRVCAPYEREQAARL